MFLTTDGSEPTAVNGVRYTSWFIGLDTRTELRVIAFNADFSQSVTAKLTVDFVPLVTLTVIGVNGGGTSEVLGNGSGTNFLPGTIVALTNSVVRLTALDIPNQGWLFKEWRGFTNSHSAVLEVKMDKNRELKLVHVTTNVFVEATGPGKVILDPAPPYEFDQRFRVTAVPNPGSFFLGWRMPNGHLFTSTPITFSAENYFSLWTTRWHGQFAPLPAGYHPLSLHGEGNVSVLPGERFDTPISDYAFTNGARVRLTAVTGSGYAFTGWTGTLTSASPAIEITINGDTDLTAHTRKVATWSSESQVGWSPGKPAVGRDGTVYVVRGFHTPGHNPWRKDFAFGISAYDRFGLVKWQVPVSPTFQTFIPPFRITEPAIGPDGIIYVALTNKLTAFTPDGDVRWVSPFGGDKIALRADSIYLASDGPSIRLVRLDTNGNQIAEVQLPRGDLRDLAVDSSGNLYVLTPAELFSYSISLRPRWSKPLGNGFEGRSLALGVDGRILIPGTNQVASLDSGGALLWSRNYKTTGGITIGNDAIYLNVISPDGRGSLLNAVDLDGTFLWAGQRISPDEDSLSTVVAEDGTLFHQSGIFVPSPGGSHCSLRHLSKEGAVLWDGHFKNGLPSAPVLSPDGKLYFAFGFVHAVDVGLAPAQTGWPMERGDWLNSGASYGPPPETEPNRLALSSEGGPVVLTFTASSPEPLVLQSSPDLVTWADEQPFTSNLRFEVTTAASSSRFFRVVRP